MKREKRRLNSILLTLLKANNDRILAYQQAASYVRELDLQTIFLSLADESRKNASELFREIRKSGGKPSTRATTTAGKIYRIWMEFKALLTGRDRDFVLRSCAFVEAALQHAYQKTLAQNLLTTQLRQIIRHHQVSLRASAEMISNYQHRTHYGFAGS